MVDAEKELLIQSSSVCGGGNLKEMAEIMRDKAKETSHSNVTNTGP